MLWLFCFLWDPWRKRFYFFTFFFFLFFIDVFKIQREREMSKSKWRVALVLCFKTPRFWRKCCLSDLQRVKVRKVWYALLENSGVYWIKFYSVMLFGFFRWPNSLTEFGHDGVLLEKGRRRETQRAFLFMKRVWRRLWRLAKEEKVDEKWAAGEAEMKK